MPNEAQSSINWPRIGCYVLATIVVILLVLSGIVIWLSQGPDPGDVMVLMAIPMLGIPMVPCCLLLLGIAIAARTSLKPVERRLFVVLGGSFVVVYGLLYALG
ncbi:MAG: hypothetical protein AAF085_00285 [Planctomycetota bacterium]